MAQVYVYLLKLEKGPWEGEEGSQGNKQKEEMVIEYTWHQCRGLKGEGPAQGERKDREGEEKGKSNRVHVEAP